MMTIEVNRDGKWVKVNPGELTNAELCDILSDIQIDSDEFISDREISMWYTAIQEAIDRLNKNEDRRSGERVGK
jgi:hypothetical protein